MLLPLCPRLAIIELNALCRLLIALFDCVLDDELEDDPNALISEFRSFSIGFVDESVADDAVLDDESELDMLCIAAINACINWPTACFVSVVEDVLEESDDELVDDEAVEDELSMFIPACASALASAL